MTGLVTKPI